MSLKNRIDGKNRTKSDQATGLADLVRGNKRGLVQVVREHSEIRGLCFSTERHYTIHEVHPLSITNKKNTLYI